MRNWTEANPAVGWAGARVRVAAVAYARWPFLKTVCESATLRTVALFGSGNLLATGLGLVGSLVQARYLRPEELGLFAMFGVVRGYLTFLHLGVFDGLQREIPVQVGRGDVAAARRAAAACLSWIAIISLVTAAAFLGLATRAGFRHRWMEFWGWASYVPILGTTFYGGYLGTTYRTRHEFVTLSNTGVKQAILGTAVLPLFPILGYYGACIRNALTSSYGLLLLHARRPLKVRPTLDWSSFVHVTRIGLPLSVIGYVSTSLWTSLEGTLILAWFGTKGLGLYAVAAFVRVLCNQLAQNLNQVLNVKIYEQFGRSGRAADCLRAVRRPMTAAVVASIPFAAIAWFLLPRVVPVLIPSYIEAVPLTQLMLLMGTIILLSLPTTILWAAVRLVDCLASVGVGFLTFIAASFGLHECGYGLQSVVIGSILGQIVSLAVSYALVLRLVMRERASHPACESEANRE